MKPGDPGCLQTFGDTRFCCPCPDACSNAAKLVKYRIACYGAGYPGSEARYLSIEEFEKSTGLVFDELEGA